MCVVCSQKKRSGDFPRTAYMPHVYIWRLLLMFVESKPVHLLNKYLLRPRMPDTGKTLEI